MSGPGRNSPPSAAPRPARAGPPAGRATGARAAQGVGPRPTSPTGPKPPCRRRGSCPRSPSTAPTRRRSRRSTSGPPASNRIRSATPTLPASTTGTGSCPFPAGRRLPGAPRAGPDRSSAVPPRRRRRRRRPRRGRDTAARTPCGQAAVPAPAQSPARPPRPRRAPLVSGGQGLTALAHEGEARGEGIAVDKTLPFVAAGRAAHAPLARSAPLGGVSVSAVRLCVRAAPRRSGARAEADRVVLLAAPQPRSYAASQVRGCAGRVTGAVFRPHTDMVMGCQVTAKPMEMALAMT